MWLKNGETTRGKVKEMGAIGVAVPQVDIMISPIVKWSNNGSTKLLHVRLELEEKLGYTSLLCGQRLTQVKWMRNQPGS